MTKEGIMIKKLLKILVFIMTASIGGFALLVVFAYFLPDREVDKNIPWNNSLTYKVKPEKIPKHKVFAECVGCADFLSQSLLVIDI
jgi:hypothetical protein